MGASKRLHKGIARKTNLVIYATGGARRAQQSPLMAVTLPITAIVCHDVCSGSNRFNVDRQAHSTAHNAVCEWVVLWLLDGMLLILETSVSLKWSEHSLSPAWLCVLDRLTPWHDAHPWLMAAASWKCMCIHKHPSSSWWWNWTIVQARNTRATTQYNMRSNAFIYGKDNNS